MVGAAATDSEPSSRSTQGARLPPQLRVRNAAKAALPGLLSQGSSNLPQSTPNLTSECQKGTTKEKRHTREDGLFHAKVLYEIFFFSFPFFQTFSKYPSKGMGGKGR